MTATGVSKQYHFVKEEYVLQLDAHCFRVAVLQVRCNILPLNSNVYRYREKNRKKECPFCKPKVENEKYFLYECFVYNDLRIAFLSDCVDTPLHDLLKAENSNKNHCLSRYIFHAINKRKSLLY